MIPAEPKFRERRAFSSIFQLRHYLINRNLINTCGINIKPILREREKQNYSKMIHQHCLLVMDL